MPEPDDAPTRQLQHFNRPGRGSRNKEVIVARHRASRMHQTFENAGGRKLVTPSSHAGGNPHDPLSRSCSWPKIFCFPLLFPTKVCPSKSNAVEKPAEHRRELAPGADRDGEVQAVDLLALVSELIRTTMVPLPPRWDAIFWAVARRCAGRAALCGGPDRSIARCGDAATAPAVIHTGVNGPAGTLHTCTDCGQRRRCSCGGCRYRAGRRSARLTVRNIVAGRDPARVVIDPGARLPAAAKMFATVTASDVW